MCQAPGSVRPKLGGDSILAPDLNLNAGPKVGPKLGLRIWDPNLDPNAGRQIWDRTRDPKLVPKLGSNIWSQIWNPKSDPNLGPKSGSEFGSKSGAKMGSPIWILLPWEPKFGVPILGPRFGLGALPYMEEMKSQWPRTPFFKFLGRSER